MVGGSLVSDKISIELFMEKDEVDSYHIGVIDGEAITKINTKLLTTKWVPLKVIQLDYWSSQLGLICSVKEAKTYLM